MAFSVLTVIPSDRNHAWKCQAGSHGVVTLVAGDIIVMSSREICLGLEEADLPYIEFLGNINQTNS